MPTTGLLEKLEEKQKGVSKKSASYYTLNQEHYQKPMSSFLNFVPNPERMI
jgi:8-oxo-dGTP diphosphatase